MIIDRVIEVLIINPQLFEDCYIANKNKCKELYQKELNQNHNKKLDVYWKEKKYSDFCDFYEKAIIRKSIGSIARFDYDLVPLFLLSAYL